MIQRALDEISTIRLDDSNVAKSAIFFIAKDLLQQGARFEEHGKAIIESTLEQAFETINADYQESHAAQQTTMCGDIIKVKDMVNYYGYDRQASVFLRRKLSKLCSDFLKGKEIQSFQLEQFFRQVMSNYSQKMIEVNTSEAVAYVARSMSDLSKLHDFKKSKNAFTRLIQDFTMTIAGSLSYGVSQEDRREFINRSAKVLGKLSLAAIKNEKHLRDRIIDAQRLYKIYDRSFSGIENSI